MTTLLLTGATGLIGSSLQRLLAQRFPEITLTTCSRTELPDARAWRSLPHFDFIIHAAGYASPALFLARPLDTAFLNTTALMILLDKLLPGGRLLYLSTSEVYSGCRSAIHSEDDIGTTTPASPRGIYIESKRCGEAIIHAARAAGAHASIARVSLAYGPGCRKGDRRVMSELIEQALYSPLIVLKDGGCAKRTYCYVDDISSMLLNILTRGTQGIYNVAGRSDTTIASLAHRIARIMHRTVKIPRNATPAMEGAPHHVTLSMSRYEREFGPVNYVDWEEGLKKTVAWHRALWREKIPA